MNTSAYVGKAGELAVMAELAWRGYNVAMPEVDEGDDIFAVNQENGNLYRVQVKTSDATAQDKSARYQFRVKKTAISNSVYPERTFVFVLRNKDAWKFVIIDRSVLDNYISSGQLGEHSGDYQQINLTLDAAGKVMGSKNAEFTHHLGIWKTWPEIATKPEKKK